MTLFQCLKCGRTLFPARLLCPGCGACAWAAVPCRTGHIEATTALHRHGAEIVHLASVRTAPGVLILARLAHSSLSGEVVLRERSDGAVVAQAMEDAR